MEINIETSLGELVDKITILEIKKLKIFEKPKLKLIENELELLISKLNSLNLNDLKKLKSLKENLLNTNLKLWEIEDKIRLKEKEKQFDDKFIELARSVYFTNDKRFEIKNEINNLYDSKVKEVKSYKKY